MRDYSKILVTGGAGFIGSHVVDRLVSEGLEVTVLDSLRTGRLENISELVEQAKISFVKGDIRDSECAHRLVKNADAVIHCAALVSVTESIENPLLANDINVGGTLNLLQACISSEVRRFVCSSSAAVYGNANRLPVKEDYQPRPMSPYAVSKLAMEHYARVYYEIFGLHTVSLRLFNVYGQRQAHSPYSGVLTQFIDRLSRNLPPVIYGDGNQTRDFTHVRDAAEAHILALKSRNVGGEVFNISSGVGTAINDLVKLLLKITQKENLGVVHNEPRKGDIKHSFASIGKAAEELNYHPKISLREGLAKTVRDLRL